MIETLFGSLVREQALIFIHARGDGYAREIARFFKAPLDSVQKQLKRLERGGVLNGERRGRTIIYKFNERYEYLRELQALLGAVIVTSSVTYGLTDTLRNRAGKAKTYRERVHVKKYNKHR